MKKEFIDYMYELRADVQTDIDRLVEIQKQPTDGQGNRLECEAELRTRRSQIQGINRTIKKYIETHSKNI